jgi:hypothetical protein
MFRRAGETALATSEAGFGPPPSILRLGLGLFDLLQLEHLRQTL